MTESTKGMTAEEAIRERITKAKEGKEKLWTQHENAQDDSSKQMFFLLYKEIAGHVDEAEAILLLLKTDRMALAKRVAEELTIYRRGSRGLTAHERALAYDQLGHFMKRLKRGEIWSELESKSEEGVK